MSIKHLLWLQPARQIAIWSQGVNSLGPMSERPVRRSHPAARTHLIYGSLAVDCDCLQLLGIELDILTLTNLIALDDVSGLDLVSASTLRYLLRWAASLFS